jgi:AsmA protein
MSRSTRRTLLIAGGVAAVVLAGLLVLPSLINLDSQKSRIEAVASEALGMKVRIDGHIRVGIVPRPRVTVESGSILDAQGTAVVHVERAHLSFGILPLLHGELRIRRLDLARPSISIERNLERRYNVEKLFRSSALLAALDGGNLSISHGTIRYADQASGADFLATEIGLSARHIRVLPGKDEQGVDRRSIRAKIACGGFRTKQLTVTDLKGDVVGKKGVFEAAPITMRVFGGKATAKVHADFTGAVPQYQVRYDVPRLRVEAILQDPSRKVGGQGEMDFTANLSMRGKLGQPLVETVDGEMSLRGSNLLLVGYDLDKALGHLESSQSFHLVDVGAVFLAGPLGLAVTRGYTFTNLLRGADGDTRIGILVSDWRIEHGVAKASDVAMKTAENRIALQGAIDFAHQRFEDVTVAVVDRDGCPTLKQVIHGTFDEPKMEKPTLLKSISGPVRKIFKQAKGVLPGKNCETFYAGSVAPPE